MKFRFIATQRETWPVKALCEVLGVSRQGFYRYAEQPESLRESSAAVLDAQVREVFEAHEGRYGSPRIRRELRERELHVGKRRIEQSMLRQGLFARMPKKYVVTTQADEAYLHPSNDLNRDFTASRPNERWVTDITYLRSRQGWVYLASILDLCTRKVVGWSMGESLDTNLPLRALHMGLAQRTNAAPLLHHSDRGCQYTSEAYRAVLESQGIAVSMSRKGNCWDNAVAESFFATLKKELVHRKEWATHAELEAAVFEYIEVYYNRKRRHSSLGYRTPCDVENDFLINRHAA